MTRTYMKRHTGTCLVLSCVVLFFASCARDNGSSEGEIVVWSNSAATTPVLPLYAISDSFNFRFEEWNTTMAFQSLLLAGDGTLWVGHLEGFARAKERGAPVRLLAVTGWRKWQILSTNPNARFPDDFVGGTISFAPADGAGRFFLEKLLGESRTDVRLQPVDVKPLMLRALEGKADAMILPEPFATILIEKCPALHRIDSLEEYYGRVKNRPPEIPWAGIAVNSNWADAHPEETRRLLDELLQVNAEFATLTPREIAQFWPEEKAEKLGITRDAVEKSLANDPVLVRSADDMTQEIDEFLKKVK